MTRTQLPAALLLRIAELASALHYNQPPAITSLLTVLINVVAFYDC